MIAKRVELAQPLPCFDRKALQLYEARLLQYWHTGPDMCFRDVSEFMEQTFGRLSFDIMWQMRTPFQHLGCYQIEWCGSDYGRPERSTCILCRCPRDPDYEIAAVCKLPECQTEEDGGTALGFRVVRQRALK